MSLFQGLWILAVGVEVVSTCTDCEYLYQLWILVQFVSILQVVSTCTGCVYLCSLWVLLQGVSTCTVSEYLYRLWVLVQVVSTCKDFEYLCKLWVLLQVVSTCTGCEYLYRLWLLEQVVSSCTGCEYLYSLWVLVQFMSTCTGAVCVYCKNYCSISYHFIKLLRSLSCDVYVACNAWAFTGFSSNPNEEGCNLKCLRTSKHILTSKSWVMLICLMVIKYNLCSMR
jgi:hypothetical protein